MRQRGRSLRFPGTILVAALLLSSPAGFALDPALDVSQYSHMAWKIRDGFPNAMVFAMTQTPDGYLWLGTELGLFRFDGVQSVSWQALRNPPLPSNMITSLLGARDGTLWIGTRTGLASWKDGKLTRYEELAGQVMAHVIEGRDGVIWTGTLGFPAGKLCEIRKGGVRCYGEDGRLETGVFGLYEDRKGNLWVGTVRGLWRWGPGAPEFYPIPGEQNGVQGLAEDEGGALLISLRGGIRRLAGRHMEMAYPFPDAVGQAQALRLLRDRDGGLWIGTSSKGILHVHQGKTDVFERPDGLSGDDISEFFEDREGSIWVATRNGLDRFRNFPVVTFSVPRVLGGPPSGNLLVARDGSIWFYAADGLNRWFQGNYTIFRQRSVPPILGVRQIVGSGLPDHGLESFFQDRRGRIWIASPGGIGYLENGKYIQSAAPGGAIGSIAEDAGGNLWIANRQSGLVRLSPDNAVEQIPWARLGHEDMAGPVEVDPSGNGVWLGFFNGGVVYFAGGQVRAKYTAADGLGEGRVNDFWLARDGAIWAATAGGLSRLKDGHAATLSVKNGLPCDTVHGAMDDEAGSLWLHTACGLVSILRSELDAWVGAPDKAGRSISAKVFDASEGMPIRAELGIFSPHAGKSPDGKLWFATSDGLTVVDPRHLPVNELPPPVHIEKVIADSRTYDVGSGANAQVRLPALARDLEIHYTALSLVAPEKVLFRYKLEGYDRDWKDAGAERKAFYGNLPPRSYQFRVKACNNSAVWNEAGAFLDFSVAPAYYQTAWFQASCVGTVLALLATAYRLRLRYLKRQFNIRLEARVGERTRIARDLHDTLLQSFQGVLMKFDVATGMIPDRPSEAQQKLEAVIEQARHAITEGRDAVQGMRSSTVVTNDLARAISRLGEELSAGRTCPQFHVRVEGASRDLVPLVRDEVHRIVCEAMRNAFQHAEARRIDVDICYGRRQLRLIVRDDGKGIEPVVLEGGGRAGHFGLPGMQERARLVGGKLSIRSTPGAGTEAELNIPASLAYAKPPGGRRWMASGKGT